MLHFNYSIIDERFLPKSIIFVVTLLKEFTWIILIILKENLTSQQCDFRKFKVQEKKLLVKNP